MASEGYDDIFENVTQPDTAGLLEDPFDEFGHRKKNPRREAPPEPEGVMQRDMPPPNQIMASASESADEFGRLRPQPPADAQAGINESQAALDAKGANWNIPETLPQPRDVTGQQPAVNNGSQPAGVNGGQPPGQPVPLDQWVRNQYGEKVRQRAPGEEGANIFGGQGQELPQAGIAGKPQPAPLHPGTLKAMRAQAEAAVPQIPNVPMHPQQRAQLMQHREDLIQGILHQKMQFVQRQTLARQRQESARDENALKADRQEKRDKELHEFKLQEAQAKAEETRSTAAAKASQETIAHQSKTLREYEKEIKAEYEMAVNGDKTGKGKIEKENDRPEWMATEDTRNNEAVRRAKQHHENLGLPWKGADDVREPISAIGEGMGAATTGKPPTPQAVTPPAAQTEAPQIGPDDVTAMLSKAEEMLRKAPSQGPLPFQSPSADDLQVRDALGGMAGLLRRAKKEGRGLTPAEVTQYGIHHHTLTKVAKRRQK